MSRNDALPVEKDLAVILSPFAEFILSPSASLRVNSAKDLPKRLPFDEI